MRCPETMDLPTLSTAVDLVKRAFVEGAECDGLRDVGFVGNASGHYPWEPTPIVDLDICVFVDSVDPTVGHRLTAIDDSLTQRLAQLDVDFETRIIRGAYKRTLLDVSRPVVVAHLGVFTEAMYREASPFLRWGWRKYRCTIEPGRFARLAPPQPSIAQLLHGPRGVHERLSALVAGRVVMHEWILPELTEVEWAVSQSEPLFAESCFSAGATIARNHGRALGCVESDSLPNREFFAWYNGSLFPSGALMELMRLKSRARDVGYRGMLPEARAHAVEFLTALASVLE